MIKNEKSPLNIVSQIFRPKQSLIKLGVGKRTLVHGLTRGVRAGYGPLLLNGPWLCHIFGPTPLNPWTMRVWPAEYAGCP